MRKLMVLLMAGVAASAMASVSIDSFDTNTGFTLANGIEQAVPETKEGRQALHMHVPCEGEGVVYIGQRFEPLQDWTGYCRLHFSLFATTTGEASHIQVQLFDRHNNQVRLRRALKPHHLGKWIDITWDFKNDDPEDKPLDFSNIKLLLISCWQDYYGHSQGDVVDYWIADMRRERCFGSAALGAAPTASAPTLDGKLDDACWAIAPMTEQFYRRAEGVPAKEDTSVQTCWDDENLYLGVRASAEVLDPRLQRLNEFRASETEHDGRVYGDDAIEVFLGPAEDRTAYYHFAVNALATKFEGREQDKSWDGEWSAASETYDGYWVTEIAIPWDSVGFQPNPSGMMWANVCRNNVAQDELSTWSPVSGGFHAPDEFGSIMLLPEPPVAGVRSGTMPRLLMGRNVVTPQLQGFADGSVQLRLMLQQDSSEAIHRETVQVSSGETKEVQLPAVIEDPGAVGASYSALDPATDLFYFQTPMVTFETAAVERLTMSIDGTATVSVNGTPVESDQGTYETYLEKGPNVICLEADENLDVSLQAGGLTSHNSGWKQSDTAPEGWQSEDFDDSGWQAAEIADGRLDAEAGQYLRRVISAETTHLWVLADPGHVYINAHGAQHLPFVVSSTIPRNVSDAKFVIELPPGIEWVDWGDKTPYKWIGEYTGHQMQAIERDGQTWQHHEFSFDPMYALSYREGAPPSYPESRLHAFTMVVEAGDIEPEDLQMRMWVEAEGGAIAEVPVEVPLTVLPELADKSPENVEMQLWHGFQGGAYSESGFGALMDTWRKTGFNAYVERTTNHEFFHPLLQERGFKIVAEWLKGGIMRATLTQENRFENFSDEVQGSRWTPVCPSWTIGPGREATVEAIADHLRQAEILPNGLMWDMEHGPKSLCYCQRCMDRFAEEYDIDEELNRELLMGKYYEQWLEHCIQTWAELSAVYQAGLKAAVPDGQMYTYSGYQTEKNRERYCIDWSIMSNGCDVASAGYGWNEQIIQDTVAALGDTPLLSGVGYWEGPRRNTLKLEYLRLLIAGADGIMHFHWAPFDGLDYQRMSEAMALIADNEAFFTDGVRADEMAQSDRPRQVQALRHDGELLVFLMNPASASQVFTLTVPAAEGPAREYYSDAEYDASKEMVLTVGPFDVAAVKCTVE